MITVSRRRFLKITGFGLGAAAAVSASEPLAKSAEYINAKTGKGKGIEKIPTTCDICFWKCGAIAYLKDGELWKIEGNPEDPLSNGRLCPRGTGGIGAHFDKDRLKSPLIRKNERGEDEWVAVTWDEALSYIAEKMNKIKAKYGPESVALFSHGIGGNFLKHTLKAYGSPNVAAPSFAQCRGPRDVGFELTFGEPVGSPERTDIENADCLVLIGSHLGENMHNTQVQEFSRFIENKGTLIVVDPRFSVAAGKAKYYLPIKPGTDTALILAWMNVIVSMGLYDKEYVEKYGFGFEQFSQLISLNTPEWAYIQTGIDPEIIRATAIEMAKNKPRTLVHPGRHTTWYGNDAQRSRAIALLNALLGSWGRKGGFFFPASLDIPNYPYPEYPHGERGKVDNPGKKYPFASETITTGIREATITGEPYPIKGWLVYATNLIQALPDREETIKAIQNLDLMVVVDVVPSEIAGWADVVLPEDTYLERFDDLSITPFKKPFISLRQPVISSPGDTKPNWWIARELAIKLGLGHYYPWTNIEEYFKKRLGSAGYSYDELKKKGILKGEETPIFFEDGIEPVFYTPSGKIEFYSPQLQAAGFSPVPEFEKPKENPPGYLRLIYGRSPVHTFSRTQSNHLLSDLYEENEVWVNTSVAMKYGYKSGDKIRLANTYGVKSEPVKVKVTERIRPDCVFLVHGFGQTSKMLKSTYKKGASDSLLLKNCSTDPLMGGTGLNNNFVTFEEA